MLLCIQQADMTHSMSIKQCKKLDVYNNFIVERWQWTGVILHLSDELDNYEEKKKLVTGNIVTLRLSMPKTYHHQQP